MGFQWMPSGVCEVLIDSKAKMASIQTMKRFGSSGLFRLKTVHCNSKVNHYL